MLRQAEKQPRGTMAEFTLEHSVVDQATSDDRFSLMLISLASAVPF